MDIEERPCVNDCVAGVCAGACSSDADCGSGTCHPFFIDAAAAGGLCVAAAPCDGSSDCSGGQVCRLFPTADGALTLCAPPRGLLSGGEVCELGWLAPLDVGFERRCAALECDATVLRCTELCGDDADCPTGYRCETVEMTIDGRGTLDRADDLTASYGLCQLAEGSLRDCTVDTDCDAAEGCGFGTSMGAPRSECVVTQSVTELGASCTSRCRTPFGCLADYVTLSAYCPGACVSDGDCAAAGLVCRRFAHDRIDAPWTLCVDPSDPRGEAL
jgi:hypothetical protein